DIPRRELEAGQLVRIEPDAHRILGTEQCQLANTGDAAHRVEHVRGDVVRDVGAGHRSVARDEPDHHDEVAHRLCDGDALLLYFLRQLRLGQLELVLDLYLRDVGIGA